MASADHQAGTTHYDLQPLEDALEARGLTAIYTRDFMQTLADDTANLKSGQLSLADVKNEISAPVWLRNALTGEVDAPNPGLRTYSGHWYNSYLRIAAYGYGKGPDLLIEARHRDGRIGPPDHHFDPSRTCAPVQLTSHVPYQDDQLAQKQQRWTAFSNSYRASRTCTLLQLQITQQYLQSGAPRIDKIVCMGLGSLTQQASTIDGLEAWYRPYSQHLVALSIADALDDLHTQNLKRYGANPPKIQVLAQDPGYSNSDKAVLTENGITVLEDPHGLIAIDENTLVMSAFPSFPLYEIIADMLPAGPAAIFDASLPASVTDAPFTSAMRYNEFAAPRVKKMLRGWRAHELRWDEQELVEINREYHMAMDWLPRMRSFIRYEDDVEGDEEVEDEIARRQMEVDELLPSGVQWLRQRIVGLFKM